MSFPSLVRTSVVTFITQRWTRNKTISDYSCQDKVEDEEDVLYPHFLVSLQISFPSSAALPWHVCGGWLPWHSGSPSSESTSVRISLAVLWKAHGEGVDSTDSADCRSGVTLGGRGAPEVHEQANWTSATVLTRPGLWPRIHTKTETSPYPVAEVPNGGVSGHRASQRGAEQEGHELLQGHAFMELLQCQILESTYLRLGPFQHDKMACGSLNV